MEIATLWPRYASRRNIFVSLFSFGGVETSVGVALSLGFVCDKASLGHLYSGEYIRDL